MAFEDGDVGFPPQAVMEPAARNAADLAQHAQNSRRVVGIVLTVVTSSGQKSTRSSLEQES